MPNKKDGVVKLHRDTRVYYRGVVIFRKKRYTKDFPVKKYGEEAAAAMARQWVLRTERRLGKPHTDEIVVGNSRLFHQYYVEQDPVVVAWVEHRRAVNRKRRQRRAAEG